MHVCASESNAAARMKWQVPDADFWCPEAVSHKRRQRVDQDQWWNGAASISASNGTIE